MVSDAPSVIPRRGYFYVILAALFWAVSGSSGKFLFKGGVTPMELVQMRVTLSAAVLFVYLLLTNRACLVISRRDILYFGVLGTVGIAMVQFTYFYSISKIHVAAAILLQYLAPAFIALHAVLIARERLARATVLAVAGSLAGCYLVVGAYNLNVVAMNWKGIAAGIAAGLSFAWYAVHGERGMRRYHPWTVVFYALLFAALFWNIALPPFQAFRRPYSPVQWTWILYIAVLGTVVPYGLYSLGINLIRSTRASITATLEPITAALISFLFLGETLEPLQVLGGAVVIASVIVLQTRREYDENTPAVIRSRAAASGGDLPGREERKVG